MVKKEFISNVTGEVWHKENIKNWLKTFDKPLFISGTTGIGKSLLVNTILRDYNIIAIDLLSMNYFFILNDDPSHKLS